MATRYYVTGIQAIGREELLGVLRARGTVNSLSIIRDAAGASRGFGFVDGHFEPVPLRIPYAGAHIDVKRAVPQRVLQPCRPCGVLLDDVVVPVAYHASTVLAGQWTEMPQFTILQADAELSDRPYEAAQ